mmetsp:Transcript_16995/g.42752  ORF Transcript_16995/g.42752 Transcript_16995/m.42752 type:complete len:202 (-) Transcript_16995:811-1416(-)
MHHSHGAELQLRSAYVPQAAAHMRHQQDEAILRRLLLLGRPLARRHLGLRLPPRHLPTRGVLRAALRLGARARRLIRVAHGDCRGRRPLLAAQRILHSRQVAGAVRRIASLGSLRRAPRLLGRTELAQQQVGVGAEVFCLPVLVKQPHAAEEAVDERVELLGEEAAANALQTRRRGRPTRRTPSGHASQQRAQRRRLDLRE